MFFYSDYSSCSAGDPCSRAPFPCSPNFFSPLSPSQTSQKSLPCLLFSTVTLSLLRLSLQHHKLKVCACAVHRSELMFQLSKKTVLEKKIPSLETIKGKKNRRKNVQREISIHSIKQTVDMYTHKYICRWIYFPDSTR